MSEDTDFAALYRELGINATGSLSELRGAWRRRVAKLHPDQGGNAEDTGRLQQLNQRYDAALAFHARYGRLPGAAAPGQPAGDADESPLAGTWRRADTAPSEIPAAGFGRIPRYFVAVSLIAIAVLGWRVTTGRDDSAGKHAAGEVFVVDGGEHPAPAIASGMGKETVRDILGEPLDMHALRWNYGPSWVEFRCDKVVDWYSSPLRPLQVSAARDAWADDAPADDRDCD